MVEDIFIYNGKEYTYPEIISMFPSISFPRRKIDIEGLNSMGIFLKEKEENPIDILDSEKMIKLSYDANKKVKKDENKIIIGYLSGSITHNSDFELIKDSIKRILDEYPNVYLEIMGYLDLPEDLKKYESKIIRENFTDWQKLPNIIAGIDINLAPLEKSIFNDIFFCF